MLGVLLTVAGSALANTDVRAVRVDTPPQIDGRLQEAVWQQAAVISDFYQRQPDTGEPVTEPTKVYICYDQDNLYFGFFCQDDPEKITAKELARDVSLAEDDRVQIILDTFMDHRSGYWFQIGPRGSIGDALVSENGAAFNKQWDGLWEGKARITDQGWTAELAIPFKTLSFRAGQTTWGLKLIRHIKRKLESVYWPTANLDTYRFQVSDAGTLRGLEGISQGIGLDVTPYGLVGMDQGQNRQNSYPSDVGGELYYQITPGMKGALTVNTDFAQTEVDKRQINLTRFDLHFPEKRDFFLDGANYFNFGIEGDRHNPYSDRLIPFFSRRMGLDNTGNPVPIIGGGKVTGQFGNWNMGFLHILDDRADGRHNFTVGRLTRNFGEQSTVGVIGTMGNAVTTAQNQLGGVDLKLATSNFRGNKNLSFMLFGLRSNTTGLIGGSESVWGSEILYPNDMLFFRLGTHRIGNNFLAGMGFVPRAGIQETYLESALGPRPKRWGILQYHLRIGGDYITDLENRLLTRMVSLTPLEIEFDSGDQIIWTASQRYEQLTEDFQISSGHIIPMDTYTFWRNSLQLESAQHRNFWATGLFQWGDFFNGSRRDMTVAIGYKIAVPLFVGVEMQRNDVTLPDGSFAAEIYGLNANILFSPDITLYNFIQYDNFSNNMGWQSRFSWILRPGNEILLVWNSLWDDPVNTLRVTESATRFKVKYTYRF